MHKGRQVEWRQWFVTAWNVHTSTLSSQLGKLPALLVTYVSVSIYVYVLVPNEGKGHNDVSLQKSLLQLCVASSWKQPTQEQNIHLRGDTQDNYPVVMRAANSHVYIILFFCIIYVYVSYKYTDLRTLVGVQKCIAEVAGRYVWLHIRAYR